MNKINLLAVPALALVLALSACKTDEDLTLKSPVNSLRGMREETNAHDMRAAEDALAAGNTRDALELFRVMHKKKPNNPVFALRFAQLLRKSDKAKQAVVILAPFTLDANGEPLKSAPPELLLELAAADIALGDFGAGEKPLRLVLDDPANSIYFPEAYNLMGVVLDARGAHKDAEDMFQLALAGWKGNPASVMNNLALSLASQGLFDQSLATLRKALVIAPDKQEVARNIQIVTDLRDCVVTKAVVVKTVKKVVKPRVKRTCSCGPCPTAKP